MDKTMFDSVIGKGLGPRTMNYGWRDVAMYAVAVGAGREDLPYIYERCSDFKALPTFLLLPYLNSLLVEPKRHVPYAPNELVGDIIIEKLGRIPNRLHMAMELFIHKTINPVEGTLLMEDKVVEVYDWDPKGVVAQTEMKTYDLAGNPVATCLSTHFHGAFGGFGGPAFKSNSLAYPDRDPDFAVTEHLNENQAILYRLTGDTYDVHIDTEVAKGYGYEMPFMQGLGTYGFAVRMVIQAIIPYQPERVKHLYGQFRKVVYPGQNVKMQAWEVEKGRVYFKLLNENGEALLNNGLFEYE